MDNGIGSVQAENEELSTIDEITDVHGDKFTVLCVLGRGGSSVVYRVRQLAFGREVALKLINSSDPQQCQRLLHEARATAKLAHPNIIKIFSVSTTAGELKPFLVLEYFPCESLDSRLRSAKTLDNQTFLRIFDQILAALEFAHKQGFIHRDLKPSNILISDTLQAKIADFGIAKAFGTDSHRTKEKVVANTGCDAGSGRMLTQAITPSGELVGSPLYMSPEQCRGEELDQRSDIYSLGCMMYTALTGAPPFDGDSAFELMYRHINEDPPNMPRTINLSFQRVILKAMAKDPMQRYSSAASMRRDLHDEGDTQSLNATVATVAANAKPVRAKKRALSIIHLLIMVFLPLTVAVWTKSLVKPNLSQQPPAPVSNSKSVAGRIKEIQSSLAKVPQHDEFTQDHSAEIRMVEHCEALCDSTLPDAEAESIRTKDNTNLLRLHWLWAQLKMRMQRHMRAMEHLTVVLDLLPASLSKEEYAYILEESLGYYQQRLRSLRILSLYSRQFASDDGEANPDYIADLKAGIISVLHQQAVLLMETQNYDVVLTKAHEALGVAVINSMPNNNHLIDLLLLKAAAQVATNKPQAAVETLELCSKDISPLLQKNSQAVKDFQIWRWKMIAYQMMQNAGKENLAYQKCVERAADSQVPPAWLGLTQIDQATWLYNNKKQKDAFSLFAGGLERLHEHGGINSDTFKLASEELDKARKAYARKDRSATTQSMNSAYKYIHLTVKHDDLAMPGGPPAEWHKMQ